jgi:hypothetical protein
MKQEIEFFCSTMGEGVNRLLPMEGLHKKANKHEEEHSLKSQNFTRGGSRNSPLSQSI